VKRSLAIGLWALATVVLATLTSLLVLRWNAPPAPETGDFHQWMHQHLDLTPEQHKALEPAERRYEETRRQLDARIAAAGRDLAEAVRSGKADSPAIRDALQRLHAAQGELQQATLDHFFEMKEPLGPGQAEQLLQWTHDRLLHP
jgi:Spy/CpxP family protein refolding chaperone